MRTLRNFRESGYGLPAKMPPLPFLVFLLTGDANATVQALVSEAEVNDPEIPFFDRWITPWERRLLITRALQSVDSEIVSSIARYSKIPDKNQNGARLGSLPLPSWSANQDVTQGQFQRALLAIDIFPRCVLILTVFEEMVLEHVAALLRTGKQLAQRAQMEALIELTRNIAVDQGWSPGDTCDRSSAASAFESHVDDSFRSDTLRHEQ